MNSAGCTKVYNKVKVGTTLTSPPTPAGFTLALASWSLTLGPILYFSLIHMIFVSSLRYRLPAEYPLCVLSAVGLTSWFGNRSRKSSPSA